jgi:hypothetical protein
MAVLPESNHPDIELRPAAKHRLAMAGPDTLNGKPNFTLPPLNRPNTSAEVMGNFLPSAQAIESTLRHERIVSVRRQEQDPRAL